MKRLTFPQSSAKRLYAAIYKDKYQIPGVQIVKELKRERVDKGIEVHQAANFLKNLDL